MTKKITATMTLDAADVRLMCIRHDLYTWGTVEEYDHLLCDMIGYRYIDPDYQKLYEIAADIVEHSDENKITNIMSLLCNECVKTYFLIEEE